MMNAMEITHDGENVLVDYDGPAMAKLRRVVRGVAEVRKVRGTAYAALTGDVAAAKPVLVAAGYLVKETDHVVAVFSRYTGER